MARGWAAVDRGPELRVRRKEPGGVSGEDDTSEAPERISRQKNPGTQHLIVNAGRNFISLD